MTKATKALLSELHNWHASRARKRTHKAMEDYDAGHLDGERMAHIHSMNKINKLMMGNGGEK